MSHTLMYDILKPSMFWKIWQKSLISFLGERLGWP